MTEITLQLGGKPIVFCITGYCPGSPGTWDEPEESPEIEWHAKDDLIDAMIDEFFDLGIEGEIGKRLLEAIEHGRQASRTESAIERAEERRHAHT